MTVANICFTDYLFYPVAWVGLLLGIAPIRRFGKIGNRVYKVKPLINSGKMVLKTIPMNSFLLSDGRLTLICNPLNKI
jgi:hypothetical protein